MAEHNHKPVFDHHCIPDLQAVLRTKMGDDLIVENYTATDFLAPGENCGSVVLKVDAVIGRKGKNSKSEELHMVAKIPPLLKWHRDLANSPYSFKKEIFMYETILPAYKELERKCGIKEEDIIDLAADFYGSRLNLKFGDVFDINAVILLENLKHRGYYSGSQYTGLDIHHSRAVVKAVARFHAIGIAVKMKNPDFFEVLKVRSARIPVDLPEGMEDVIKEICRSVKQDPVIAEYYDVCVELFEAWNANANSPVAAEEPWSTLTHTDFWVSNILFHMNEESGHPDDVKLIDFQTYLIQSALRDLCFLLGVVGDHEVSTKYIPELIDLYHKTLVSRLEIMGCDASPFSRDQFDQQLSKDALHEFPHIAFALKFTMVTEHPNIPKPENPLENISRPGSDAFRARLRDLVTGYANRGWF